MKKQVTLRAHFAGLLAAAVIIAAWTPQNGLAESIACANYNLIPDPNLAEPIVLRLPHTSGWFGREEGKPALTVTKLPLAGLTRWQGMPCDTVWLPIGSEIRTRNNVHTEGWLYTVRPDGYLNYRWAPEEP